MSEAPETKEQESKDSEASFDLSDLALALAIIIVGSLSLWYPVYLGLSGDSVWNVIGFVVFYVFAGFCFLMGIAGTILALQKDPDLWRFIKEILPIHLPGADAWQNAAITAVLAFLIGVTHLVAFTLLGASGWVALLIKTGLLFLFIFAALFLAVTIDDFVFKPLRGRISSGEGYAEQEVKKARRVVVALGGSTGTIIAVIELFVR